MPVDGELVTLSITATDPDGDPLTISWTQTSPVQQGTFSNTDKASTTWFSPALDQDLVNFSFQVSVSDGHNPAAVRQVTLPVSTPSYANDIQAIWDAKCTVSCHKGASPEGQLSLVAGSSFAALVGPNMVASCSDTERVESGSPATSGLIDKLTGNSCGTRMPEGDPPLSAAELVMIESWIRRGALDN
jgi:hypothetical protein